MINVRIVQCENGFIITDENTGVCYVANKIGSYSCLETTVTTVLEGLVEDQKPVTALATEEVI